MGRASPMQPGCVVGEMFAILLAIGVAAAPAESQCRYDVTIIQAPECPPFGNQATIGTALNDLADVVGYHCQCFCGNGDQAFLWDGGPGLIPLQFPAGTSSSEAWGINDALQIVGEFDISGDGLGPLAFFWDGGQLTQIPPAGGTFSQARSVNGQGQVVGTTGDGTPYFKAFRWEDGVMSIIPPLIGPRSTASDINDAGQVVGWMGTSGSDWRGFLWEAGVTTDLGALPGGFTSQASAINNLGEVVGYGRLRNPKGEGNATHAFLWNSSAMIDLGTLSGFVRSFALDINDDRTVVGFCRDFGGNINIERAFVWRNGVMSDLNDLIPPDPGFVMKWAEAINSSGEITGLADGPDGTVAVLLTPIGGPIGDINNDGVVNVLDLIDLLLCFGQPAVPGCEAEDVNDDGVVNVLDLIDLLLDFGLNCSCADPEAQPQSLEEALEEAGLDEDDWDDFMDIMQTGTQEEKDNWHCWMTHYLSCHDPFGTCNPPPPNCPGSDPFGGHRH